MSGPVYNILFLCTGNSARSILAEAAANHPTIGLGRLKGYSAGSQPTGQVHPMALETLARHGIDAGDPQSISWETFTGPGATEMQFLITVCDNAANEPCPIWPGRPPTGHWGVPDPAAVTDDVEAQRAAFESAFQVLKRRIELFAQLNLERMAEAEIRQQAARIARETAAH